MESFAVDVAYRLKMRSSSAEGVVGGRALTFEMADRWLRPDQVTGSYGMSAGRFSG